MNFRGDFVALDFVKILDGIQRIPPADPKINVCSIGLHNFNLK